MQTKPELSLLAQNQQLHNIELTQVEQLRTPQNPAELENQAQLILDDMPPASPRSWRQRHILENIINCAQYRMTENKLKDERIQTLVKEIHDLRNKQKPNRKIIPNQGACFLSHDDITSFFAKREAEQQRKHEASIDRLKAKISTAETKFDSLSVKRTRVDEMEREGHLPKRWKTGSQLMEESDQLEQRISDMKVKLRQIETVDDRISEASEDCDPEPPIFPES